FIPSASRTVQGKREDVFKKYGNEWRIQEQGGGNGNWLLTKKSDILVDGKSYRSFVLEHYDRMKLTEKLASQFREDLINGVIQLEHLNSNL
ncbi:hypothetical protein, partial [Clostridioides difficile]|uniref:hypothetical protein n=1 Tax=Clostridioides difficile TaxID=1496 RepID=UPI00307FF5E0